MYKKKILVNLSEEQRVEKMIERLRLEGFEVEGDTQCSERTTILYISLPVITAILLKIGKRKSSLAYF